MKIGLDIRLLTYRRGMGNYVYHLVTELAQIDSTNHYILYTNQPHDLTLPDNFQTQQLTMPTYPLWEQLALSYAARRDQLDILHCPANTAPLLPLGQTKLFLTIHDVMYLLPSTQLPISPSWYQRLGRWYRQLVVPPVARRADKVITVSAYSRQDIAQHINLNTSKIAVTLEAPNAVCHFVTNNSVLQPARQKYNLTSPFILALAGIDPRKNTAKIIEAFAKLPNFTTYQLVLVGLSRPAQHAFRQQAQQLDIVNQVIFTDFVPEADLVALYNLAELFIYPSLYEGFGLPILEAMACGTPVITAPSGSIPEIAGDAAIMVNPTNVTEMSQAMYRVLSNKTLAEQLRQKGLAQVKRFSWRNTARQTLQLYEQVK